MGNNLDINGIDNGKSIEQPSENSIDQFDTNFDAGVEANEETDPKKYIQQLTGKLSQKIREYTKEQGSVDADLNKYVIGMVVKQAAEGLDDNDKKDVIAKINSSPSEDEEVAVNGNNSPSNNETPKDGVDESVVVKTKAELFNNMK